VIVLVTINGKIFPRVCSEQNCLVNRQISWLRA
jgi:hypothetical protein